MASKKNDKSLMAAIEIGDSRLHMAVATVVENAPLTVHTRSVTWRVKSSSLHQEGGDEELTAAMRQLFDEFKLHGQAVYVTLSEEFCVTRVVTGTNEKVKAELDQLEERSSLYLSLGHGKKALGGTIRAIDARHQHALLTVVNQATLDVLVKCSKDLGVKFEMVEPSLVSLSRLLGAASEVQEEPNVIVNLGEKGVEVGIMHNGQLLLDYRPPGNAVNERIAGVIAGHIGRLQRYCDRYVGFSKGQLKYAFICGTPENVAIVTEGFQKQTALPLQILQPNFGKLAWDFADGPPDPELAAVLGTLLLRTLPKAEQKTPNLMERLNAAMREPLKPALIRALWPVAAALLVSFGIGGVNFWQGIRVASVKAELEEIKAEQERTDLLLKEIDKNSQKCLYLKNIKKKLSNPSWDELTTMISQCLPKEVWLESINVDRTGVMIITGASYSQDGVYEFEKWLNEVPGLQRVSVKGTETTRTPAGPAISFNMKCEVVGSAEDNTQKGGPNDNA